MGRNQAANKSSPGKRNGKMKDEETTPTKMRKLHKDVTPGRNKELNNLAIAMGDGNPYIGTNTTRSSRQLFSGVSQRNGNRHNSDSDKENRESRPARPLRGKTEVPDRSVLATSRRLTATVRNQRTPRKQHVDEAMADAALEESDHSDDEWVDKARPSKPKKSVSKKLAPPPAAKAQQTPKKVAVSSRNEPATPGISSAIESMTVGTPNRRSGRAPKLFGIDLTDRMDVSDEEVKVAKQVASRSTANKKKASKQLVIEPTASHIIKHTLADLRSVLHTSSVPDRLPCREEEYEQIKKFVLSAVGPKATSQAMYISGVPGTGKTASTKAVIREVAKNQKFTEIYINAMEFLDPKHIFVHIYKRITEEEKVISVQNARNKLNFMFQTYDIKRKPILLLVDELDQLSSRRQEIIYDIFNWTTLEQTRVSVIAIANTLDLPERMLSQKISSRLGTNRIIFQPYEFQQIEQIILARTQDFSEIVSADAVKLAARRVAAISGDLRKAIDTLRRSVEIAIDRGDDSLTLQHVLDAHKEATSVALVLIVCNLSRHEELVFSAAVQQVRSRGVEEFNFAGLYREYRLFCTSREGIEPWHEYGIHSIVMKMATTRLLVASPGKNMMLRKLRLGMLLQEAEMALKQRKIERDRDNEISV